MVEYIRGKYGDPSRQWAHEVQYGEGGVAGDGGLLARVAEAEAIVIALRGLVQAMYDSDYEGGWPRDASRLQGAYEEKYGVSLYPEEP
jgi:hypothetical protein